MSASNDRVHAAGASIQASSGSNPGSKQILFCHLTTPHVRERRLRKVMEMIESQPTRSVRELALEVHLSPAHLQRLFKHETGVDMSELITERRLQRAAQLLADSDLQIKEIAYAVGYEHHSSFVRAFQRRFALPPRRYRRIIYGAEC